MTWIITLKYQVDDDLRRRAAIEYKITDQAVKNSNFNVLAWQFERMVDEMNNQLQKKKS
jgi:hypothetical protein